MNVIHGKKKVVSCRLDELDRLKLAALSQERTKSDTIREALHLLWEKEGRRALYTLYAQQPRQAERLENLCSFGDSGQGFAQKEVEEQTDNDHQRNKIDPQR